MARITRIELSMIDLVPKVERVDAIQSFVSQETPFVTIYDSDGASGTGYCYTIGTGGPSVMALLKHTLAPALIGRDPDRIEAIWRELLFMTHATAVGAITSLALAAIDTALWDLKCKKAGLPLWKAAGGSRDRIPLYTTEGGWLNLEPQALVDDALWKQVVSMRSNYDTSELEALLRLNFEHTALCSDLCVSCVAVRACMCGAVCCLAAVPASEAAHAQPVELLICVAVPLTLLIPV